MGFAINIHLFLVTSFVSEKFREVQKKMFLRYISSAFLKKMCLLYLLILCVCGCSLAAACVVTEKHTGLSSLLPP